MEKTHKSIHFVGIKGVGMASLAVIAKQAGIIVTGSDTEETFITDAFLRKHDIEIFSGFDPEHIKQADLIITTGAHGGYDNPEVSAAKTLGIPVLTQGEAVGEFMKGNLFVRRRHRGVSVAGSHGKTTTTAMIATILKSCGYDPSYIIGTGDVPSLEGPGHLGRGEYVVVEADEYATEPKAQKKAKLLWQDPRFLVLTNIDFDHPDIYNSIEDIEQVFKTFVKTRRSEDIIIACGDDERVRDVIDEASCHVVTYGFSPRNNYVLVKTRIDQAHMFLSVEKDGHALGDFLVHTPGKHNALNALGAITTCIEIGAPVQSIAEGIKNFRGSKRRMELLGTLRSGALVFDDYAHHPREISETLKAFKSMFPDKKLTVFFQPHTYSRTKSLFDDFVSSLSGADTVGLLDIFGSKREVEDSSVSSQALVIGLKRVRTSAIHLPQQPDVLKYIEQKQPSSREILIFMGAGDVYKAAEQLELERNET